MVAQATGFERMPAVAGLFYPSDSQACRSQVRKYLDQAAEPTSRRYRGAVVPHAGWVCSGAIAGLAIGTVAQGMCPDVVVVFGAIHTPLRASRAVLDDYESWSGPIGQASVASAVRRPLSEISALFAVDDRFHRHEHAVEVELPFIRQVWPDAAILPIEMPLDESAAMVGEQTAAAVQSAGLNAVYLASSDLTHYGPDYRFTPAGVGSAALEWAKQNDRLLLDRLSAMSPQDIVQHVKRHQNACGGGAIAAMLAACGRYGKLTTDVLRHENSHDVLNRLSPRRDDNAVGYAAVVVSVEGSTVV